MKVKLTTSRAGLGFSQQAGEIIEVGEAEGASLIASSQAEPVREQKIERAVKLTREKAVK